MSAEPCTTPDCPGDGRYTAPGRGHMSGCTNPFDSPPPAPPRCPGCGHGCCPRPGLECGGGSDTALACETSDRRPTTRDWAEAIWNASRADEGTISATGADIVARGLQPLIDQERSAAKAEERSDHLTPDEVASLREQARPEGTATGVGPRATPEDRSEFRNSLAPHLAEAMESMGIEDVDLSDGIVLADVVFCLGYRLAQDTKESN